MSGAAGANYALLASSDVVPYLSRLDELFAVAAAAVGGRVVDAPALRDATARVADGGAVDCALAEALGALARETAREAQSAADAADAALAELLSLIHI